MWWIVIILVGSLLAVYAGFARPKSVAPPSLQDIDVPSIEDGKEISDGGGTFWITDIMIPWYGDLDTKPIYNKGGGK